MVRYILAAIFLTMPALAQKPDPAIAAMSQTLWGCTGREVALMARAIAAETEVETLKAELAKKAAAP